MLEKNNTSFAYNLGRFLAIGDYMQYSVHNVKGGSILSAGLVKLAKVRPMECIKVAYDRIHQYLSQIEHRPDKQGVIKRVESLLNEVNTYLVAHAGMLSIDEQVEMHRAYWDQRNAFFNKTNTNNKD